MKTLVPVAFALISCAVGTTPSAQSQSVRATVMARPGQMPPLRRIARQELDTFQLDVAALPDSGECFTAPAPSGTSTMLLLYRPTRAAPKEMISIVRDIEGKPIRYSDRRGLISWRGVPGGTMAQLDSSRAAAHAAVRSTAITLNLESREAIITNEGGGRPDVGVIVPAAFIGDDARYGAPLSTIGKVISRCSSASFPTVYRPEF